MAQVQISASDVTVAIEDEDAEAKALKKLALEAIREVVDIFGTKAPEED